MFSESLMKYLLKYQTEDFKREEPEVKVKERFSLNEALGVKHIPVHINNEQ